MSQHHSFVRGITTSVAACTACFALSSGATAQNLVTNGNFATNDLTGWTFTAAQAGSGFHVDVISFVGLTNLPPATNAAYFGATSAFDDSISQTLATTVGTQYIVSFVAGLVAAGPGDLSASFGGQAIWSATNPGDSSWHTYEFTETAASTSTILQFNGQNYPSWNGVTNVSVTAVPEPQNYALMLAGLGLVGVVARRRKAQWATRFVSKQR